MISDQTYLNPHLQYEETRANCLPILKRHSGHPDWTKKLYPNLIEVKNDIMKEQKVINVEENSTSSVIFKENYDNELYKKDKRFHLIKG